jgi:hypothetical protein
VPASVLLAMTCFLLIKFFLTDLIAINFAQYSVYCLITKIYIQNLDEVKELWLMKRKMNWKMMPPKHFEFNIRLAVIEK